MDSQPAEPMVKGTALLSVLEFARKHFGPDAPERLIAAVPEREREPLRGMLIPMSWYPLPCMAELVRALETEFGRGDLSLAYERGVWSATAQMNSVLKVFIRVLTPHSVVSKATRIWRRFHTSGDWKIDWIDGSDRAVRCELTNFGVTDPPFCATLRGWMAGLAQLATSRTVRVTEPHCRCRGGRACVFEIRWS